MRILSVQFLVAYDHEYLKASLPAAYPHADEIILAFDRQRLTWAGNYFEVPLHFFDWVKTIDVDRKIRIYEDDFYDPAKTTRECDTNERRMLAEWAGQNRWHIQIDSDEQFLNFPAFIAQLRQIEKGFWAKYLPIQVAVLHLNIYKEVAEGYLVVPNYPNKMHVAATQALHRNCRNIKERTIYTQHLLLHQTFARSPEELTFKLENYGHNTDFDTKAFIDRWQHLTATNHNEFSNFHHLEPEKWPTLKLLKHQDVASKQFNADFLRSVRWPPIIMRLKNLSQWLKFSLKRLPQLVRN